MTGRLRKRGGNRSRDVRLESRDGDNVDNDWAKAGGEPAALGKIGSGAGSVLTVKNTQKNRSRGPVLGPDSYRDPLSRFRKERFRRKVDQIAEFWKEWTASRTAGFRRVG